MKNIYDEDSLVAIITPKASIALQEIKLNLTNEIILMNITIDLKFIFIIDAFREYNSHLQDITS